MGRKIAILLNDEASLRNILQEAYNDSILLVNEATRQISLVENAIELKDASIDDITKFSKAMKDLIKCKDDAISKKLNVGQQLQNYIVKSKIKTDDDEAQPQNTAQFLAETMKMLKEVKDEKQTYITKQ